MNIFWNYEQYFIDKNKQCYAFHKKIVFEILSLNESSIHKIANVQIKLIDSTNITFEMFSNRKGHVIFIK